MKRSTDAPIWAGALAGVDLAEIGALKVRFGSSYYKQTAIFEGRLTRYKADRPAEVQHELIESFL